MSPPSIRNDKNLDEQSVNKNENNLSFTSITSPLRRISSFIDEEEEEDEDSDLETGGNTTGNPNELDKKEENEFAQLNRSQEHQRKRGIDQESSGSPLRKKSTKQSTTISISWGGRLKKLRSIINEHCRNSNFDGWSREIWQLGNWWLEVAGEEAAGIVFDLIDEYKKEQARLKRILVIPTVCGNIFLDKLQVKCLMLLGKNESALEVCKETLKSQSNEPTTTDLAVITEIRFLEGCLSRVMGKIPAAIEAFEQVLQNDPNHVEAHDHLYGITCGLLPYKARDPEEDGLVQAYRKGKFFRVIHMTMDTLWTRWFGDETVMVLLVSSLACTFNSSALYTIGQRSVNQRPDASVSWYCVGLFYQVTGRSDEARRYLFKSGIIGSKMRKSGAADAGVGPAWIALGHSFAAYGDHDQAVSAYVAAVKSHSPGSVDPSLFLAIEYLRVRQATLSAAYLLDAHAACPTDPRVLNELACLQAGKENYAAAKKFLTKAMEYADEALPPEFKIPISLNYVVVSIKELISLDSVSFEEVKSVLDLCADQILSPILNSVRKSLTRDPHDDPCSALSLFPWTANSAHPSSEFLLIFTFCVVQEWRSLLSDSVISVKLSEDALEGYRLLLECRNEHRNLAMEAVLIERQNRLLSAHSTLSPKMHNFKDAIKSAKPESAHFKTPRTPLIRSHSLAMLDSTTTTTSSSRSNNNNNSSFISAATPNLSFSGGALPTASSIAASVSRRRLSLRRQMTGLRFDPADSSASFSSLESDNSFMSVGPATIVSSIHLNDDLMMTMTPATPATNIANQSMLLMDGTDIEADCEFVVSRISDTEEDMQLDSE